MLCPFHWYGNCAVQIVWSVVDVTFWLTARFNVATESQPDAAVNVAVYVPACVMFCPFHWYGSCAVQIARSVVDVRFWLTAKFNVATESQPDAAVNVAVYVPACVMFYPFHWYGSCAVQIVWSVVDVMFWLTVRFNVATESQPDAAVNEAV